MYRHLQFYHHSPEGLPRPSSHSIRKYGMMSVAAPDLITPRWLVLNAKLLPEAIFSDRRLIRMVCWTRLRARTSEEPPETWFLRPEAVPFFQLRSSAVARVQMTYWLGDISSHIRILEVPQNLLRYWA